MQGSGCEQSNEQRILAGLAGFVAENNLERKNSASASGPNSGPHTGSELALIFTDYARVDAPPRPHSPNSELHDIIFAQRFRLDCITF